MSARFLHLPYALPRPLRTGSLFSCLNYAKGIPTILSNGTFSIHPDLVAKWLELDKFLTQVFQFLPHASHPPSVVLDLVPSNANYTTTFATEDAARLAGSRALSAFQHLITLCSWKMAYNTENVFNPEWVEILLSKGIPPTMVEMLRNSPPAIFSTYNMRAGAVVDVSDEASLSYVRQMVNAQVPVYIDWGTHDLQYHKPTFKRVADKVQDAEWINTNCFPSIPVLKTAADMYRDPPTSSSDLASAQPPPLGPVRIPPPSVKGSGQKRGETWKEFFARRSLANKSTQEEESFAARKRREDRAKRAHASAMPGRKGANVFHWEEANGFRIRTPVGFGNYIDMWGDYCGARRRYDEFADEWDLCSEFEESGGGGGGYDDDDDDDDDDPPMTMPSHKKSVSVSTPGQLPSAVLETPSGNPLSVNTLTGCQSPPGEQQISPDGCHDPKPRIEDQASACQPQPMACDHQPESQVSLGDQQVSIPVPPIQQLASVEVVPEGDSPHVGDFVPSNHLPDPQSSGDADPVSVFIGNDIPESQAPPTMHLRDVLQRCYGFAYSSSSNVPPHMDAVLDSLARKVCEGNSTLPSEKSLRTAVTAFLEKLITTQPPDETLSDMLDGSLVDKYAKGHLIVRRRPGRRIAIDGTRTAKTFYEITSKATRDPSFALFLGDATSVLYLIRVQPGPELSDVVVELVRSGFPVNTCILRETIPTLVYDISRGLGFLPFDYRPRRSDYVAYIERRDALLRRNYGRAALMKGGIVGRLARESLGDRADFVVSSGPSDDAVDFGSCIEIEGSRYWDDDLDCEDEEIICGVYKISTGNCLPVPTHRSALTRLQVSDLTAVGNRLLTSHGGRSSRRGKAVA